MWYLRGVNQNGTHTVKLQLDPFTYQALVDAALAQDRTMAAVLKRALWVALDMPEARKKIEGLGGGG